MAKISLYLDEHIQSALADALRARGIDVLTTQEAKNIGLGDSNQIIFAAKSRRSLLLLAGSIYIMRSAEQRVEDIYRYFSLGNWVIRR